MSTDVFFTRESLDQCLKALAKEFRKLNGKAMPAEIVLIGGASVLANYGFRDMTYDVDAMIQASSAMKDAINHTGDALGLPNGWLNSDFTHTKSYSPKLLQYSVYYKRFSNIVTVRTVTGEYLIAMKLMSGRQYKNDISDIVGILREQREKGKPISFEQIDAAVYNLYDGWDRMPQEAKPLIENILSSDNLEPLYQMYRSEEKAGKEVLVDFEKNHPGVTNEDNVNDILKQLKARRKKEGQER
jgi:hypothetical protein